MMAADRLSGAAGVEVHPVPPDRGRMVAPPRTGWARLRLALLPLLPLAALCLPGAAAPPAPPATPQLAATPPMGWNSWDSYGTTIREAEVRATARLMASKLKRYGWRYVVIDEGWYESASAPGSGTPQLTMDAYGRYIPNPASYPSAAHGAGMKPLADYIHSLGLKFGVHILRGIPRQAVAENLPIQGSSFHAADAADTSSPCPWNGLNDGVKQDSPAGQAYYNSIARLYASWGVDLVKADCIDANPYRGGEIQMLSTALGASGRPIILSLSPGPAPIANAGALAANGQMWRMANDLWDVWQVRNDNGFPQGVENLFGRAAAWEQYAGPGHWPNGDMLPIGELRPNPGWGRPRASRLTQAEQQTLVTAWCVFRSPLIVGGNLLLSGPQTLALLTNPEVIAVDQQTTGNHPVPLNDPQTLVWEAMATSPKLLGDTYVVVVNLGEQARHISESWAALGLPAHSYRTRDLWQRKNLGQQEGVDVTLAPHASELLRLDPSRG